eukprot:COSAG01_NODE_58206_length_307_cov_1.187500_1_plen_65_part_01
MEISTFGAPLLTGAAAAKQEKSRWDCWWRLLAVVCVYSYEHREAHIENSVHETEKKFRPISLFPA